MEEVFEIFLPFVCVVQTSSLASLPQCDLSCPNPRRLAFLEVSTLPYSTVLLYLSFVFEDTCLLTAEPV